MILTYIKVDLASRSFKRAALVTRVVVVTTMQSCVVIGSAYAERVALSVKFVFREYR